MEIRTYTKAVEERVESIEVKTHPSTLKEIKDIARAINILHGDTFWTLGRDDDYMLINNEAPAFKIVKQLILDLFDIKLKRCSVIVLDR